MLTQEEKAKMDEQIKNMSAQKIEEQVKEKAENSLASVEKSANNAVANFEDATQQALANFKPEYKQDKSMYENGKDLAKTIGINDALHDEDFREEQKERVKKNIRTDQDTEQVSSEIKKEKEIYRKLEPVLKFQNLEAPCDLKLMRLIYGWGVIPFCLYMLVSGVFNLVAGFFKCINSLFNSIFGQVQYLRDGNGDIVKDEEGRPIPSGAKVNLLTKIIFIAGLVFIALLILVGMIKTFTGWDLFEAIKTIGK